LVLSIAGNPPPGAAGCEQYSVIPRGRERAIDRSSIATAPSVPVPPSKIRSPMSSR
jgi:hypothetical protein